MKRTVIALFAALIALVSLGCKGTGAASTESYVPPLAYKVGVMTGSEFEYPAEYAAAQDMVHTYGSSKVVISVYADDHSENPASVAASAEILAADPEIKAIVFVPAVTGVCAAIDKVRETRPDMLFICGSPDEGIKRAASKSDVVMASEVAASGNVIAETAQKMGANTFIHYSFSHHLADESIAARRALILERCDKLGITFLDVTAPDPDGAAGVLAAQQFILDDVPRQVAAHGVSTAFFATSEKLQEPLIRAVFEQGAIFPMQCVQDPFCGYSAALGIDMADHEGDAEYLLSAIRDALLVTNQHTRMSTYAVSANMLMVWSGVEYAIEFCENRTDGLCDESVLARILKKNALAHDSSCTVSAYKSDGSTISNVSLLLIEPYDFSQPHE